MRIINYGKLREWGLSVRRPSFTERTACCPWTKIYTVFLQLQSKLETSLIIPTVILLHQPRHEGQKGFHIT